jgi:hypothetical protein
MKTFLNNHIEDFALYVFAVTWRVILLNLKG